MKKTLSVAALTAIVIGIITAFTMKNETPKSDNPFFSEYNTLFNTPPFHKIKNEHYHEAFLKGIEEKLEDVKKIAASTEEPTFENTIVAYEKSGELLGKVSYVFSNLKGAHTNETIKEVSKEITPLTSKMYDDIFLNEKFFRRVKSLYEKKDNLGLTTEQKVLLTNRYKAFVRGGANLSETDKETLRKINSELSSVTLAFGDNVLNETNAFEMYIDNAKDLAGLPEGAIKAAAEDAKEHGQEGKYRFTMHKPSLIPFLTYADNRDLREKMLKAYVMKGDNNNVNDNKANIVKIVNLRLQKAKLLGYKTHAHYVLEENMAQNPENVFELMDKIWKPAVVRANKEVAKMQEIIKAEGGDFELEAWDWWYYAEKVKKAEYAFDEEMLRPYFKLENVIEGCFIVANKLWGLTFVPIEGIDQYHPEVKTYQVKDKDGKHLAIYYADHHPRASKRGGAWMNEYQAQHKMNGDDQRPIITNVMNFTKPTADQPSLLSIDEVNTLFHEFGHAVHGMLSDCTYPSISGTNTPRDFVEFPSQVFENWCMAPEVLNLYAKHYQTGENIPVELLEKMKNAGHFNQGFATVEYLSAAYLDMYWHTLETPLSNADEVNAFEDKMLKELGLLDEIVVRYRSTYFNHIFSSPTGYSSGYYGYIWAQVLDADTYKYFEETNVFDPEKALSFRNEILARGSTDDVMEMYKRFRGSEPKVEALIDKLGLKPSSEN